MEPFYLYMMIVPGNQIAKNFSILYPNSQIILETTYSAMKTSAGEDLLEAACLILGSKKDMPTVKEVAGHLSMDPITVQEEALELEKKGLLRLKNGEIIELSEKGKEAGFRIIQKHRILECFLSEILGMERNSASVEACILEHTISDDAIDKLENFITLPRGRGRRLQRGKRRISALADFSEGTDLRIVTVQCRGGYERLADLGILPGEIIRVVRILNHKAVVIRVKGCDIALSPEIASSILVEKLQ